MKLLLVDDDENILRAMARGLRNDYEVKTCGSAAEALREIEAGYTPDAILSDIRMPGMQVQRVPGSKVQSALP
jgi:DNA-binding NtrC family response regulator